MELTKHGKMLIASVIWLAALIYHGPALLAFTAYIVLHPVAYMVIFYGSYLIYAAYQGAVDRGETVPFVAALLIAPYVIYGYMLDLVFDIIAGTALFRQVPWFETKNPLAWTFTARLKYWKNDSTLLRGGQARVWARLLDPFVTGEHV